MPGARSASRGLRVCAALLLALACGCLPATARASGDTAKLEVAFSPYRLGSTTSIDLNLEISGPDGGLPSPVTSFDSHLPAELELIGSTLGLAICQPAALLADGLSGCSPNARLGSGSATAEVPFGPEILGETANVEALMGPPIGEQVGVLIYAESQTPVFAQLIFPGILLIGSGPESLDTNFPPVPTLPGARDAAVTKMTLEIGPRHLTYYKRIHGRQVSYRPTGISLPSKCPRGGFLFVADVGFQDGTLLRLPYAVPCPSSRHR
ncbi:MAG: hypothetical protein ACHQDY_04080 [Solirubrobacterales bacterium]